MTFSLTVTALKSCVVVFFGSGAENQRLPLGDDEDERYCGEKTSGFGRHFIRRIVDLQEKDGCMAPEPLLPPGSMFHDHVGREGIQCFVGAFPKRCVCMVNRIRCDDLSLTQIFAFTNETADPQTPRYSFLHNRIQYIQEDVFRLLPDLRHLDFRKNSISGLNNRAFNGLSNLRRLWLGQNGIQSWEPHSFNNSKLRWLDLKANRITLEAGMFSKLNSLYYLDISSNLIEHIAENTFEATPQLEELSLANNSLVELPENVFAPLHYLQFLNLSNNPHIKSLPMDIFKGLIRLDRLNLSGVSISNIHREMFDDIPNNALIIFSKFHYCYYAAHIVDCHPKSDGISSSENLIELSHTRTLIWVLIALIPLSNLFVLIARCSVHANEPIFNTQISQRFYRHDLDVLSKLRDISSNLIEHIAENTFEATPQLEELSLANNSLVELPENVFAPLHYLQFLNLSNNPHIKSLPMDIFKGLIRLDRLNLSGVSISNIHREMFDDIPNNALIIFSKFHYCYYAAHIVDCHPKSDGISSSENLIELSHTRTLIWVLIALIPLSNLFVLIARCSVHANEPIFNTQISQRFYRHDLDVLSKLRYNLFVSNSLMTVYLLIIAIYDLYYRENYHREAYEWLHGFACQAAGMMASLSIFISLVTLCVIIIDRYICITQSPAHHLTGHGCCLLIISLWLAGIMILGIPVAIWDNVTGSFYGNNGLCLPLYLDEPFLNGWWYSSVLFFGVFALCATVTIFCGVQTRRFAAQHADEDPLSEANAHTGVATRYLVIIIVNLICWLPVIVVKIMALTSYDIGNHLHSIFAILILPLNSCLTPVLHVYLSTQFRRKFAKVVSLSLSGQAHCFKRQREDSEAGKSMDGFYHNDSQDNLGLPLARTHMPHKHSPVNRPLIRVRSPSPESGKGNAIPLRDSGARPRSF
ncbi:Relaxin receptor 1 [Hypsibius exemplaris]|uniref:Relaxin receptor 1 n=1 Tax=Hypsibius exemplaris TaxID=2072580 RepID=A0A1W0X1E7_HYPEX|nr:Relaxin receptor 1 [Hypsibius exemplaris]